MRSLLFRLAGPALGAALLAVFAGCRPSSHAETPVALAQIELLDIRVGEKFAFEQTQFTCRRGQPLRIQITNTIPPGGPNLPHNLALLTPTADIEKFAEAINDATEAQNYIPTSRRHEVLAAAPLVHPGQSISLQLNAPSEPGDYTIICTFPGHCLLGMRARLTVL